MVGFASLYIYVIVRAPVLYQEGSGFKQRFGFLLNRWHPRTYYWGVIFLTRNILCSLVPSMTTDPILQIMLLIAVVLGAFTAQVRYWPWRENMSNRMDCMFNIALLVTLSSALASQGPSSSPAVQTFIGAMSFVSYVFAVLGTFFVVAKVAIRAGFCPRAAPAGMRRISSRNSFNGRSSVNSINSGDLPVILGQDMQRGKRPSIGSDTSSEHNISQRRSRRSSFMASLAMDSISAQQQGAYELFQILQGLQESYVLAGEDNGRLMLVLEKLAGELPEEDLQRLQWAMSMLGYHVLGDKALRPSGIMLAPLVHRIGAAEQASDPPDDKDLAGTGISVEPSADEANESVKVVGDSGVIESV